MQILKESNRYKVVLGAEEEMTAEDVVVALAQASFELGYPVGLPAREYNQESELTADEIRARLNEGELSLGYEKGRCCNTELAIVGDREVTLRVNAGMRGDGLAIVEWARATLLGQTPEKRLYHESFKGTSLDLILRDQGYEREAGEDDWSFRRRYFVHSYCRDVNFGACVLMGAPPHAFITDDYLLLSAMRDPETPEGRQRFVDGYAEDPQVGREKSWAKKAA